LKSSTIWILGVLSILAVLSAIHAINMSISLGINATFQPYLIGGLTGAVPVSIYLLLSAFVALILVGGTTYAVVEVLSNTDRLRAIADKVNVLENNQESQFKLLESMQARVFLVDENIERTRKDVTERLINQGEEMKQTINAGQESQQKLMEDIQSQTILVDNSLENVRKDVSRGLTDQREAIKQSQTNLTSRIDAKLADIKEEMARQLGEVKTYSEKQEQNNKRAVATILKQKDEIADIKSKLDTIKEEVVKPKPELTSLSSTEDVKGIGPKKANELKEMGITTVGEFVLTDPQIIAEKTSTSLSTVEKLQGLAQLSMVPGVKGKDLTLLEEVGITDRKKLADQDPIDLSRRINNVFKGLVENGQISEAEKPTIEEITSWIKLART
jgi:predicted flap endonuclease-1-like 5' DNA nuclease